MTFEAIRSKWHVADIQILLDAIAGNHVIDFSVSVHRISNDVSANRDCLSSWLLKVRHRAETLAEEPSRHWVESKANRVDILIQLDSYAILEVVRELSLKGVLCDLPASRSGIDIQIDFLPRAIFKIVHCTGSYNSETFSVFTNVGLGVLCSASEQLLGWIEFIQSNHYVILRKCQHILGFIDNVDLLGTRRHVSGGGYCSTPAHSQHQQRQYEPADTCCHILLCHHFTYPTVCTAYEALFWI